jgi:hypothetical protein
MTNLLYQLYITLTPCNPWHKHWHTIEIHPHTHKGHKTQQPPRCFFHSPTPLPTSLLVPP